MAASTDYTDFNYVRFRGETLEYDLTITLSGAALPISSLTEIWFTAKLTDNAADPGLFQKTKTNGGIVATDDPGGKARVTILPADTTSLENITVLFCDVKTKETAATRETVELRGKLTIRPTPTRAIV
jgi:hypothetical protein